MQRLALARACAVSVMHRMALRGVAQQQRAVGGMAMPVRRFTCLAPGKHEAPVVGGALGGTRGTVHPMGTKAAPPAHVALLGSAACAGAAALP